MLQYGDEGDDVLALQTRLKDLLLYRQLVRQIPGRDPEGSGNFPGGL